MTDETRFDNIDDRLADAAKAASETKGADALQLVLIDARLTAVEADMKRNTALTQEIRDIMTAAKVGFKVLGGIGTAVKWAGMIAGAAVALYSAGYALMHGGLPPGK